jgi:hypothetical protein
MKETRTMTDTKVAVAPTFNRAEHCRTIAAHGGAAVVAKYGTAHMRTIGTAGARQTITRHGVAYFNGLMSRRGWQGRRPAPSLAADLAFGEVLAAIAA